MINLVAFYTTNAVLLATLLTIYSKTLTITPGERWGEGGRLQSFSFFTGGSIRRLPLTLMYTIYPVLYL